MRRVAVLTILLLLAIAPIPAHADEILSYSGTLRLSGFAGAILASGDYSSTNYDNLPVQASLTVDLDKDLVTMWTVDFPDSEVSSIDYLTIYLNHFNCADIGCDNRFDVYLDPYDPSTAMVSGGRYFDNMYANGDQYYASEDFGGDLSLVNVTPEPSSFALFGTGLLGAAGIVRRRFTRTETA